MEPIKPDTGEIPLSREALRLELETLLTDIQNLMKTDPKFLPLRGIFDRLGPRSMEEFYSDYLLLAHDCAIAGLNILEQGKNRIGPNDNTALYYVNDALNRGKSHFQNAIYNRDLDPSIMGLQDNRSYYHTPGKMIN